jgi:tRNA threonylcarbamoyladenosine biosynthesis protein TsaE
MEVQDLAAFEREAVRAVGALTPGRGATLVTLSGELGAGKTAFTKAAAKQLGITETVNSPTFVLEKIYPLPPDKPFKRLVHIDAYRLQDGSELSPLRFSELMHNPDTIIFLEWPEKVKEALPVAALNVTIEARADGSRTITYEQD